ncbi:hypothetical protein ABPG74_005570 [Tetrahymena malaccensis]
MEEEYSEKIIGIVKSYQEGITLTELLKILEVDQNAIKPELQNLLKEGYLTCTNVGNEQIVEYHDPQDQKQLNVAASDLPQQEFQVYKIIFQAKNKGIDRKDIGNKTGIATGTLTKILNQLKKKNWIKSVKGANSTGKGKNIFILNNLELSESISGGIWYKDGVLNKDLIDELCSKIENHMNHNPIMTEEQIIQLLRVNSSINLEQRHVLQIINLLLFDDKIEKVKTITSSTNSSTAQKQGTSQIQKYRLSNWNKSKDHISTIPALTKTPCGHCPLINECVTGGKISPENCIYFNDW